METASGDHEELPPLWKEQVLIDLSRQTLVAFSVTGDEKAAFKWMAEDIVWIGPFSYQEAEGIESIRSVFYPNKKVTVTMTDERWHAKRVGSAWVVTVTYLTYLDVPNPRETLRFRQRVTLVWGRQSVGPRIIYMHFSHAVDGNASIPALARGGDILGLLCEHFGEKRAEPGRLEFRDVSGRVHYLAEHEILCVLSEGPHCHVKSIGGEFVVRATLQNMEGRLSNEFMRVHRSCVVNVGHIAKVDQDSLLLDNGSTCPLAVRRRQAVRNRLASTAH